MGMNWQGAQVPYNLISVYSAVSKESFVSKEHDSFGFTTQYLLTDIFFLILLSQEKKGRFRFPATKKNHPWAREDGCETIHQKADYF